MQAHSYTVDISWEQGRIGKMCSPDITVAIEQNDNACLSVATPPEFPKGVAGIWSPEHLFTAAVSSCLMTTFLAIAENSRLEFMSFKCRSEGKLERIEGNFLMTEVILYPTVTIATELDREKTLRVLQKSEAACLISNSIKSKVSMEPTIVIAGSL